MLRAQWRLQGSTRLVAACARGHRFSLPGQARQGRQVNLFRQKPQAGHRDRPSQEACFDEVFPPSLQLLFDGFFFFLRSRATEFIPRPRSWPLPLSSPFCLAAPPVFPLRELLSSFGGLEKRGQAIHRRRHGSVASLQLISITVVSVFSAPAGCPVPALILLFDNRCLLTPPAQVALAAGAAGLRSSLTTACPSSLATSLPSSSPARQWRPAAQPSQVAGQAKNQD